MEEEDFYTAVAHPSRRKILVLLRREPNMTASTISERLRISKPTLSSHLRTLREAGLVVPMRSGVRLHYSVERKALLKGVGRVLHLAGLESVETRPDSDPALEAGDVVHGKV